MARSSSKKPPTPTNKTPIGLPDFKSSEERDTYFKERADYYTAVKFRGVGNYDRLEAKTLEEAKRLAQTKVTIGGGKYLIYAVIGQQSAYVTTVG